MPPTPTTSGTLNAISGYIGPMVAAEHLVTLHRKPIFNKIADMSFVKPKNGDGVVIPEVVPVSISKSSRPTSSTVTYTVPGTSQRTIQLLNVADYAFLCEKELDLFAYMDWLSIWKTEHSQILATTMDQDLFTLAITALPAYCFLNSVSTPFPMDPQTIIKFIQMAKADIERDNGDRIPGSQLVIACDPYIKAALHQYILSRQTPAGDKALNMDGVDTLFNMPIYEVPYISYTLPTGALQPAICMVMSNKAFRGGRFTTGQDTFENLQYNYGAGVRERLFYGHNIMYPRAVRAFYTNSAF